MEFIYLVAILDGDTVGAFTSVEEAISSVKTFAADWYKDAKVEELFLDDEIMFMEDGEWSVEILAKCRTNTISTVSGKIYKTVDTGFRLTSMKIGKAKATYKRWE